MKQFLITIGKLWAGPDGAVENQDFEVLLEFDTKELKIKGPISGDLLLAKTKKEISAVLQDVHAMVELECERCLKKFSHEITIESAERIFFWEKPDDDPDFSDAFLINRRDLTIDLYDMVRQEIILHFPLISVCSKSCKGLCPHCGANRNKKSCQCKDEDPGRQKPFKNLKKLMK